MTSTNSLTEQQLAAIDAREKAATPGPWCTDGWEIYQGSGDSAPDLLKWIGETCRPEDSDGSWNDAEFVAHARTDVRLLLDEVRRLKGQRKYLIGQLAKRDAESGRADEAVRQFLTGEQPATDLAAQPASWPTFTLQRWNWTTSAWDTHATYGPDERGEGNAYFAVSSERASETGPIRLLKNGAAVVEDDPATYYADTDG